MKNRKIIEKLNICLSVIIMTLLAVSICAMAKFYKDYIIESRVDKEKVADFYIDLVNEDKSSELEKSISLEDINPGEEKQIIFYVRNGYEKDGNKIVSDVNLIYLLQFIHTNNLPLQYSLYNEAGIKLTPESVVNNAGLDKYLNLGEVITYSKDNLNNKLKLTSSPNTIIYNKYVLKINWNADDNDSKYVKEIDNLYLKVSSYQERPEK